MINQIFVHSIFGFRIKGFLGRTPPEMDMLAFNGLITIQCTPDTSHAIGNYPPSCYKQDRSNNLTPIKAC